MRLWRNCFQKHCKVLINESDHHQQSTCFKTWETKPNSALPTKLAFLFSIFNLFISTLSQLRRDVMWLTGLKKPIDLNPLL